MRTLELTSGEGFTHNLAFEVILNKNHWKGSDLIIGQSIYIQTPKGRFELVLVGIVDEVTIAIEYAYLPLTIAQELLDNNGKCTAVYACSSSHMERIKEELSKNEMISNVTHKSEITSIIDHFIIGLKAGISSMMAMSMLLAPIFLFTNMGLSIMEKERDFFVLRTLGSRNREILKVLMIEVILMGILGSILSVPISLSMGYLMNTIHGKIYYTLDTYVRFTDYSYILFCFPLFPLIAWVFTKRILKIDFVERLSSRVT